MSSKLMICNLFLVCLIGYTWNVYGLQTNQKKDVSEAFGLSSEVGEDVMNREKREENGEEPPSTKADRVEKREDQFFESPPSVAEFLDARELLSRRESKRASCRDSSVHCRSWAKTGECGVNPGYMHVYCRKSCNLCGGCTDLSQNCEAWRRSCHTNAQYMNIYCKKTCKKC